MEEPISTIEVCAEGYGVVSVEMVCLVSVDHCKSSDSWGPQACNKVLLDFELPPLPFIHLAMCASLGGISFQPVFA